MNLEKLKQFEFKLDTFYFNLLMVISGIFTGIFYLCFLYALCSQVLHLTIIWGLLALQHGYNFVRMLNIRNL